MRIRSLLILFGFVSFAILGATPRTHGQIDSSRSNPEDVDPLVQGVRIIPAAVAEPKETPAHSALPTSSQAKDWRAIAREVGIHAETEKCLDCHFKDQPPKEAHSGNYLDHHAPETFGCVLCHGGNGMATDKQAAHTSTPGYPFLKGHRIEAACGKCHTESAVPDAPFLSGGRFVMNRYGCVACHNLPVAIAAVRYAPHLDYIGNKVSKAWLRQWLRDPTVYLPESKMPRIEMTDPEREAIVEFLTTLRDDSLLQPIDGKGNAKNGEQIFVEYECQSCHTLHGKGDTIASELERVGTKVNRVWLMTYLKNPAALHPQTKMPSYQFTDQQILDVTAYLLTHFSDTQAVPDRLPHEPVDAFKAREGFKLYISKGCAQCHGITKYMAVDVNDRLKQWDIQEAIERIKAHQGEQIKVPAIEIPESDLALMSIALLALPRNEIYKKLSDKLEDGTLGNVSQFLDQFWQFPIPLQQAPPDYYNKTVSQLAPESCGTCHQKQWQDWKTTRHSMAMGAGVWGQLVGQQPGFANSCLQCHTPLSEQAEYLSAPSRSPSYEEEGDADEFVFNQQYDAQLQSHGLVCAVCHVRSHQRFGPPFSEKAAAASVFAEGHHGGAVVSRAYLDSAFCSPCHQFGEGFMRLNGKLLENTYNEWLESPQAKNGETCQSCHMPDRRHLWRGIHDPETVRKAVKLAVDFQSRGERIEAKIRLTNTGAGHRLPTYVTPAIFVTVRLLDEKGTPIADTEQVRAIQRRVVLMPGDYREVFDTRIPPGGVWVYDYKVPRPKGAKSLEVRIDVYPDHYYNGFFRNFRAANKEAQAYIDKAFENTEKSPYLLLTKHIPLMEKSGN